MAGKYSSYPEYKNSGVEWLGCVPEHWKVSSLGYYARLSAGGTPNRSVKQYWGGNIPWVKTGEIKYDEIFEAEEYITDVALSGSSVTISPPGTLLMAMYGQGVTRGRVAILGISATYNQACVAITPNEKVLNTFLRFYFIAAYRAVRDGGNETSQMNLNAEIVGKFKISVPDIDEQYKIVDFLDFEVPKIDTLIEKQQQLIVLLKEKRQAVISYAVTKGLNTNAPMRDSGVEWLGEVPEHWDVTRVGWMCEFISYGFTNPMPTADEGPYMLTATDIEFGRVKYEEARRTSEEAFKTLLSAKSKPEKGDVLVTKDGTLGRVTVFDGEHETCISQSVALLRLNKKKVIPEFLSMAFMGADYQNKMIFDAGGTTIKHIYISILAKMDFILPNLDEQKAILGTLEIKLGKMDALIGQAEKASLLLNERRTALISAAVTGKIDVRNWQIPETNHTSRKGISV